MILRLTEIYDHAIVPALALLPKQMTSPQAVVMLLSIGLQESRLEHKFQVLEGRPGVKGPARGYWQFERAGGVRGVMRHPASIQHALMLVRTRAAGDNEHSIWTSLEHDDILAAAFARLLLWTDPKALPAIDDEQGAWDLYMRVWRPGKPHRSTWDRFHSTAREFVESMS